MDTVEKTTPITLHQSINQLGTKHRMKPNTPRILLSEKDKGRKNKGCKKRATKKMENTGKRRQLKRCTILTVTKN